VVGGIGNVRGAAAGAMLIAFVEVFVHRYMIAAFPDTPWVGQLQDIYVFGILILVLMFKPSGLFGKATVEKV
jgi:branched-chain amino acid transport system permease protein